LLFLSLAACTATSEPPRARTAPGRAIDEVNRAALGTVETVLRLPGATVAPPPEGTNGGEWIYCRDALAASGIDPLRENRAALAAPLESDSEYDALVVPGYTPLDQTTPLRTIHPVAVERLRMAKDDLDAGRAPVVVVSGGNVHPQGTPVNEALQMKEWLLAEGVPEERIVIEPCARHSHTNLRNAGRFLLANGLSSALVVTSHDQAVYFGRPRSSSFDGRCLADLGYLVGEIFEVDPNRVSFSPNGRVMERGTDPLDP
jgi:hypothetical protein